MQPYYGGSGGYPPPPPAGSYTAPPSYGAPGPHPVYYPPPSGGGYGLPYGQAVMPTPTYHPYPEEGRGGEGLRRDQRRGGADRARGRSRSPSTDRPRRHRGDVRVPPPPATTERLPAVKPGEVSFSLLVPAFGLNAHSAALRDIASATSCSITLQDEGQSSTRRTIRFVGKWENVLNAQRQVLETLNQNSRVSDLTFSEETLVLIPKDRAQNLSQSLSEIQSSTTTTIEAFPARGGVDANFSLIVVSSTTQEASSSAEKRRNEANAVQMIRDALPMKVLPSDLPGESETFAQVFIPVASRFAGSVIGKSASIVRELETETGARINLSREGTKIETPTETFRFVTVEGNGAVVIRAYERISKLIEEAKERAKADAKDGTIFKVPLAVPDHLIGVIIGKQGKVLRDLQEDTGTKIHIEHSGKDDRTQVSYRLVEISGDCIKVESAQRIIVERLVDAMADTSFAPAASQAPNRSRRARSRSPSQPRSDRAGGYPRMPLSHVSSSLPPTVGEGGEELDKMVVRVPIHQVGAVIGNRGSTVKQICDVSGARIHIEGKDEIAPDATERGVTITGTSAQIAKAFALVQRALADSNDQRAKEPPGRSFGGRDPGDRGGRPDHDQFSQPPVAYSHPYGAPPVPRPAPYGSAYPPPPHQNIHLHAPPGQAYFAPAPPSQVPQQLNIPPPSSFSYSDYSSRQIDSQQPSMPALSTPQHPSSAPPQHYQSQPQQQQPHPGGKPQSQFDLRILSQLAKNLAPIGSGNITQITGSPPGAPPPPGQYNYRG